MSLGWVGALILGVALLLIAGLVPPPGDRICRIIGILLCVVALVMLVLWLVGSAGAVALATI